MTRRHVNRITAEVPVGWGVLETAELHGPDGIQIRVTAQACDADLDTAQLAERHGAMLGQRLPGYVEEELAPVVAFSGQRALRRDVCFGTPEEQGRSVTFYLACNGAAYLATASGTAASIAAHEKAVTAIVERLALIGTPLVTTTGNGAVSEPPDAATSADREAPRPAPSTETWAALRQRWADPPPDPSATAGRDFTFSADELLVISAAMGVGLFPTVNPMTFADLGEAERSAVGQALGRALVTRGVLDERGGRLVPGPDAAIELLDVAVHPDLLTEIAHSSATNPSVHALCVRPDVMVTIEPCGPFGRRLSAADEGDLIERTVALVSAALATDDGTVSVRSTWRDGDGVLATELAWTPAEAPSNEEIRASLLAHLPGAEVSLKRG